MNNAFNTPEMKRVAKQAEELVRKGHTNKQTLAILKAAGSIPKDHSSFRHPCAISRLIIDNGGPRRTKPYTRKAKKVKAFITTEPKWVEGLQELSKTEAKFSPLEPNLGLIKEILESNMSHASKLSVATLVLRA